MRLGPVLLTVGCAAVLVAAVARPAQAQAAAAATWPPFVLVVGLLLIGVVAHRDGLFARLGGVAGRVRAHPAALLVVLLALVAAVTTVLNLDTAAAFLTPVLVLAARRRGAPESAFLYGALLMANAASLLLPGSNLTNLLVLGSGHVPGTVFAARMLPAWAVSVAITAAFVAVAFRAELRTPVPEFVGTDSVSIRCQPDSEEVAGAGGAGGLGGWAVASTAAVALAVVLMLAVRTPAPWVAAVGAAVAGLAVARRALPARDVWDAVEPMSLAGVFGVAVALGTLARAWGAPARLMAHAGAPATAALGAGAAVLVNNLPAAVLLGSRHPAHPRALLLGLNLGPNLAVTGSLSALIWWRASATVGARPSAARLSRLGVLLVPLSIAASAGALWLVGPGRL